MGLKDRSKKSFLVLGVGYRVSGESEHATHRSVHAKPYISIGCVLICKLREKDTQAPGPTFVLHEGGVYQLQGSL
jgi:hypothetical protein